MIKGIQYFEEVGVNLCVYHDTRSAYPTILASGTPINKGFVSHYWVTLIHEHTR